MMNRKLWAVMLLCTQLGAGGPKNKPVTPHSSPDNSPKTSPRNNPQITINTRTVHEPENFAPSTPPPQPATQQTFNYPTPPAAPPSSPSKASSFLLCTVAIGAVVIAARVSDRKPSGKPETKKPQD